MNIGKKPRLVIPASPLLGPQIEIYSVTKVKSLQEFLEHFDDRDDEHHTPAVRGIVYAHVDYHNPAGTLRYSTRIATEDDMGAIPKGTRGFRPGSASRPQ